MKNFIRNSLLAFLLSFSFTNVRAQYVTIPDTNFRNWLNGHGYGTCISGNQMDTTCSAVVNATVILCGGSNINDLTGISYFDNLSTLNCSGNLLISTPELPLSLDIFDCSNNQLTSLPLLPDSLIGLYCYNNQLTTLPSLPAPLTSLNCDNNQLSTLPILPVHLISLSCKYNQLTILPILPTTLTNIICNNNQLTTLPALPPSLIYLTCNNNLLTSLPTLPTSFFSLKCNNNQLSVLPALPASLYELFCSDNQLPVLPLLPTSLNVLSCNNNQLSALPALPGSLNVLSCNNNQLTMLPTLPDIMSGLDIANNPMLQCLPPVKELTSFYWSNTGITCLPNSINIVTGGWIFPSIVGVPVCHVINPNNCPVGWNIKGNVFTDSDSDCVQDTNEFLRANIKLSLLLNGLIEQQTFTDSSGQYTFKTNTGTYTCVIDPSITSVNVNCPVQGSYAVAISAASVFYDNIDFSLVCKPGFDIGVNSMIRTTGVFRPANYATVNVLAGDMSKQYNMHCASGISGTVTIVITGPANYSSAVSGALTPVVNGDTLLYTIADFGAVDFYHDFSFIVQTDTTAQLGQQVCFNVTVAPYLGDNEEQNNYYQHCFAVVNSYDPNDKEANPAGLTDTSQYWLTYTVRFQNTGNAPAQHIYILDTLDNNVNENSIQLLAYSHEPQVHILGKVVKFNFPNINLADSVNDEPNSHGYVQYKVRRNNNLPIGTQIRNTAYIYFDYNPPVQTNTTTNQLAVAMGLSKEQIEKNVFNIFPNPLAGSRTLNLFFSAAAATQQATFTVYEMNGRKIFTQPISSTAQLQQITLPALAQGIYQCVVDYDSGRAQQKLVVVK